MPDRVVLLRGVNVAGANRLPMAAFRLMLSDLGLARAETWIQSGNAIFASDRPGPELEAMIREAIADRFGFVAEPFVLEGSDIATAATDHPFAGAEPNRVHVYFLKDTPSPDEAALRALAQPGDAWHIGRRRLTLHTPGGFGASRLAERLPRLLPAPMSARNLRTVAALQAMLVARA